MVSNKQIRIPILLLGAMAFPAFAACNDDGGNSQVSTSDAGEGGTTSTGGRATGGNSTGGRNTGGMSTGGMATGGTSGEAGAGAGGEAGEDTGGTGGSAGSGMGGGGAGMGGTGGEQFDGQEVFRFDTFGDEALWTDTYRLHEAIQAALDPTTALSLGLKVDAAAVPPEVLASADLKSPATTVALIGLDAVVGVKGTVENGVLTRVGITCALCHSDVDDSVMPGIGMRIDGAANRDLNPGAIIALSPGLATNVDALAVLKSWGPGRYDPRWRQDGINHPVVIPPAYGLSGVPVEIYTGDGPISYWNAYVAITQMGGQGTFVDERIGVSVMSDVELVAQKLPALRDYQLSLPVPEPAAGSFDAAAAKRGEALFDGVARCSTCHAGETYTDAGEKLHAPDETGMEPLTAQRSATKMYRTTPLRALLAHPPYFHDGSAATLADVVAHYDAQFEIGLTPEQEADLVQYLNSL